MYQKDITKESLASGFARVEGQIQDLGNQNEQLRELVTNGLALHRQKEGVGLRKRLAYFKKFSEY